MEDLRQEKLSNLSMVIYLVNYKVGLELRKFAFRAPMLNYYSLSPILYDEHIAC